MTEKTGEPWETWGNQDSTEGTGMDGKNPGRTRETGRLWDWTSMTRRRVDKHDQETYGVTWTRWVRQWELGERWARD